MKKKVVNYLNRERPGFSGLNHILIAIALFVALFFLPFEPFTSFVAHLKSNPVTMGMCFLIICGAALLPDCDNLKSEGGSSASWDLGVVGSILSVLMVTISSIMTSIFKGKKEEPINTQHRFFWHTFLIPFAIYLLVLFAIPNGETKVIDLFIPLNFDKFPGHVIVILLAVFICIYVGSISLVKKINMLPFIMVSPGLVSLILGTAGVILCLVFSTEADLKFFGICIAVGYLFHLIGDLFADSGIPAIFPISGIFGKFWMRIKLVPITVETGTILESTLKVVFVALDMLLIYLLFTQVLLV